ncbi:MAG: hypothetical protein HYT30_02030 [Parcubacteria group bacterium]|nr:hypothetical protein [Parcubacteria group bacterium]
MESNIKGSFIPRDTLQPGRVRKRGVGGGADLLVLFAIVLLVASVALGVAVFLYVKFLESSLSGKQEQLKRAQGAFEPALIAELNRLDDRMRAAEDLLAVHLAPSVLMKTLEELTLDTVSFKSMKYTANGKAGITIDFSGLARSVNSIALQADLFGKHGAIVSPIFSNINRQQDGVAFDLSANVNPVNLRFVGLLQQAAAASAPATQPTSNQSDSSIPGFAP